MNHPQPNVVTAIDYEPAPAKVPRQSGFRAWQWLAVAVAVALLIVVLFLLSAQSVQLQVNPVPEHMQVEGGISFNLRDGYLLLPGDYRLLASAPGHVAMDAPFTVTSEPQQTLVFNLERLPGIVSIASQPPGATAVIDGVQQTLVTPLSDLSLAAGAHDIRLSADRYLPYQGTIDVEGLGKAQQITLDLLPAFAEVGFSSDPSGASILLDGVELGITPGVVEVPMGDQRLTLKLRGYRAAVLPMQVEPGKAQTVPLAQLERADGLITVRSNPTDAAISVNGQYSGKTPQELSLRPGRSYRVSIAKPGYRTATRSVQAVADDQGMLDVVLAPELGDVRVRAEPEDAEVFVNGASRGKANQLLRLATAAQSIEIRRDGYQAYTTKVIPRPGFEQTISVKLLTKEQARVAATSVEYSTPAGIKLRAIYPAKFTAGASRREPGRRANETLREIDLRRPYYLSVNEITNALFRRFRGTHDSGKFAQVTLNEESQPVANVPWQDAALFCNWLSDQESLAPFYRMENNQVVGVNRDALGYRLPTEAEWEYAARVTKSGLLRFPWGETLPPPDRSGNYADRTAATLIGRIVFNYTDGFIGAAPVGQFASNEHGLNDMGGNVAEWTNDFYEIPADSPVRDPQGPDKGEYHVIRGSSWMHGTATDLRFAFRDYGSDARQDVGFRVARSIE